MFLNELIPSMDAAKGSLHYFECLNRRDDTISVYIKVKNSYLDITVSIGNDYKPTFDTYLNMRAWCPEINQLVEAGLIQEVIKGTIDGFTYIGPGRQPDDHLLCSILKYERNILVVIKNDGTGIIQIADNENKFAAVMDPVLAE
jgi:hypothetical protein